MKPIKAPGATTSHSNSPFDKLNDNNKATTDTSEYLRIIRQHFGVRNMIQLYLTAKEEEALWIK